MKRMRSRRHRGDAVLGAQQRDAGQYLGGVHTDVDFPPVVADMLAELRLHEARRQLAEAAG